ncbi:leucine-rich repeat domain-containing protein [Streptomyces sp. NPDC026673]|uniref:leucine-rich repeat domain-containing protein n=1 Tax=Streptomyces sp. NPDC026673 TaxID=3155724 RepID=UPI0034029A62
MRELWLRGNAIEHLPPSTAELRELRHLDLRENAVAELPDPLARLPLLRQIDLRSNRPGHLPDRLTGDAVAGEARPALERHRPRPACAEATGPTGMRGPGVGADAASCSAPSSQPPKARQDAPAAGGAPAVYASLSPHRPRPRRSLQPPALAAAARPAGVPRRVRRRPPGAKRAPARARKAEFRRRPGSASRNGAYGAPQPCECFARHTGARSCFPLVLPGDTPCAASSPSPLPSPPS